MSDNTYSLGRIGLVIRGAYDNLASYEQLDVVSYQGSSYVAKSSTVGVAPTNTDTWLQLAQGLPVRTIDYQLTLPETGTQGQVCLVPIS